jgi:GDPmannose 4,6-dehydratase
VPDTRSSSPCPNWMWCPLPRALVAGCSGQDGIYLTHLLRSKGYRISGIDLGGRSKEVDDFYSVDLRDRSAIRGIIEENRPDEVYFLAAFHHSSEGPRISEEELMARSLEINTLALCHMLGALADLRPAARLLYASSSRVFGEAVTSVQSEDTPLAPVEPYGISKAAGMQICSHWRLAARFFAVSAILYNHESPLRPPHFLSQKIVQFAVRSARGDPSKLSLGNLSAQVDWGHAADTARAMWLMLQQPAPLDFVVATGELHTVRDWLDEAFGIFSLDWHNAVIEKPGLLNPDRPVAPLCGDSSKLRQVTGWRPDFTFPQLVGDMVESEWARQTAQPLTTKAAV